MSKAKFKVGDKVRILDVRTVKNHFGGINADMVTCKGKTATIEHVYKPGFSNGYYHYTLKEFDYYWDERALESVKDEKIIIYRDGNEVIALDKATGKKGIRKCNPADTFDFNIGAKLAFERLTANVTFKMLCIESDNYFVTKGKTYEFVNGVTTYDTGRESCKYKNFAEYVRFNPGIERFVIELKDGDDPVEILKKYGSTIRVGDTVEIVDRNKTYRLYTEWVVEHIANKSDIRYFCYNRLPFTGLKCKVLHIAKHNSHYENLAYVKSESNECYVIAVDGLKKV